MAIAFVHQYLRESTASTAAAVRHDAPMTRIGPADPATAPEASRALAAAHEAAGARMTNMKWTAARSPETLAMLLTWYPLHRPRRRRSSASGGRSCSPTRSAPRTTA